MKKGRRREERRSGVSVETVTGTSTIILDSIRFCADACVSFSYIFHPLSVIFFGVICF